MLLYTKEWRVHSLIFILQALLDKVDTSKHKQKKNLCTMNPESYHHPQTDVYKLIPFAIYVRKCLT